MNANSFFASEFLGKSESGAIFYVSAGALANRERGRRVGAVIAIHAAFRQAFGPGIRPDQGGFVNVLEDSGLFPPMAFTRMTEGRSGQKVLEKRSSQKGWYTGFALTAGWVALPENATNFAQIPNGYRAKLLDKREVPS